MWRASACESPTRARCGACGACAVTAVPLADALGDWRAALAVTAIPGLLALPFVARLPGGAPAQAPSTGMPSTSVFRGRPVWLLAGVFGAQSVAFTGVITWAPAAYEAAGWSPAAAGVAGAWVVLAAIPSALAVPVVSDRMDRRRLVAG